MAYYSQINPEVCWLSMMDVGEFGDKIMNMLAIAESAEIWCLFGPRYRMTIARIFVWFGTGHLPLYTVETEILHPSVRTYAGQNFGLMDDNPRQHRGRVVPSYLEEQGIERMDYPERLPYLNPIEYDCDILQRRLSRRNRSPETHNDLANTDELLPWKLNYTSCLLNGRY